MEPIVLLGLPQGSLGARVDPEALAYGTVNKASKKHSVIPAVCQSSLLCFSFNTLWGGGLNFRKKRPIKYFAMIHDDICPQTGWLDILIDELESTGADMVSAVVPIKDPTGVTSTAIDVMGDEWSPRRLTLKELWPYKPPESEREKARKLGMELYPDHDGWPETFTHERILLNTGLWVCKFDGDWCEQVCFEQHDRIIKLPNGEWAADTKSEDWNFSRSLRDRFGLKLYATRKIQLEHERPEWHTRFPWGRWEVDQQAIAGPQGVQTIPMGIVAATPEPSMTQAA